MRFYTLWFMFAAMTTFASAAYSANGANIRNQLPDSVEEKVNSLKADLEAKGYEVAQGSWHLFSIEDCKYLVAKIGNCLGNNPTAPYIIPTVPLWPEEFADNAMKDLLGPTSNNEWWTHRLDPREALVIVGFLPPPAAYFSLQEFVFTREGTINTSDQIYTTLTDEFMKSILFMIAPNPSRVLTFASMSDSVNDVVIERKSGAAFDQERAFIITPDAVMERSMTDALLRAGVPAQDQIFTESVPAETARLGLDSKSDEMLTLIRYTLPDDESAGNKWRRQIPLAIFRVRDKDTTRATEPYPQPTREQRIAHSELGLKDSVDNLVNAVKQKWGQANATSGDFESLLLMVDLLGEHCLERPMNCIGDNSDADYQISATMNIDSNEVIAVVGTLGTETLNAKYTSLAVNSIPELVGSGNLTHKDLVGSASDFASTVADTDKLYVQYYARECGILRNCLKVTEEMVPPGDELKIVQRNYVVPGHTRGPDPNQVVNPRFIVLDGATRPVSTAHR